jgi:hypothetical protein
VSGTNGIDRSCRAAQFASYDYPGIRRPAVCHSTWRSPLRRAACAPADTPLNLAEASGGFLIRPRLRSGVGLGLASISVPAILSDTLAQVTIYLDDAAERRVKAAAPKAGVSVSRWVADLVENRTRTEWPAEVLELAGAWPDFPDPGICERKPVRTSLASVYSRAGPGASLEASQRLLRRLCSCSTRTHSSTSSREEAGWRSASQHQVVIQGTSGVRDFGRGRPFAARLRSNWAKRAESWRAT